MITIGLILENHVTCIKECLESLDKFGKSLTGYNIISKMPEDSETVKIIRNWAISKNIEDTDKGVIILFIKGDEKLIKINVTEPIDRTKYYNITMKSADYISIECRINSYMRDTTNCLDILFEKIILDPNEYTRRAFNLISDGLQRGVIDALEVARSFRLGGNNNGAIEYLKQIHNKDIAYYLECMLSGMDNVLEFYRDIPNNIEADYYYVEYLYEKGLYKATIDVLKNKNINTYNISISGILTKLDRLTLLIADKLDNKELFEELYNDVREAKTRKIVFFDVEPDEYSIDMFKVYRKYIDNIVYIGLSKGNINNSFEKELKLYNYAFIKNASETFYNNEYSVLEALGIKGGHVYVKKIIRDYKYINPAMGDNVNVDILENPKIVINTCVINTDIDKLKGFNNVIRVEGINDLKGHQICLRIAKAQKLDCVLVIDDGYKEIKEWLLIKEWLDKNMDKWDVYLGDNKSDNRDILGCLDNDMKIVKNEKVSDTKFVYYNKSIYDKYIEYEGKNTIDLVISSISKGRIVSLQ
jgi:hypothetical protein